MLASNKISEGIAQLTNIAPVSQGVGTVNSAWVPTKNIHLIAAVIATGVLGASATVDAKLQQATDITGTGAKDITGKAITQIVKATGDNKQAIINLRSQELDTNNGFAFVRLSITVGVAASLVSAEVMAVPRYMPADTLNQAAVVQVVA